MGVFTRIHYFSGVPVLKLKKLCTLTWNLVIVRSQGCTVSTFGNREKTLALEFLITRSFPDANWLLQLISRNLKTKGLGNYLNDKKMRCEIIDFILKKKKNVNN